MTPDVQSLLAGIPPRQVRAALIDLCDRGLITCTRGRPGDQGSTYALAWLPLDDPERFTAEVRRRHAENMRGLNARQSGQ